MNHYPFSTVETLLVDRKEEYLELIDDFRQEQDSDLLGVIKLGHGSKRFVPIVDPLANNINPAPIILLNDG